VRCARTLSGHFSGAGATSARRSASTRSCAGSDLCFRFSFSHGTLQSGEQRREWGLGSGLEAKDPNLRRYVGNGPVGAMDPSGLEECEGPDGISKRNFQITELLMGHVSDEETRQKLFDNYYGKAQCNSVRACVATAADFVNDKIPLVTSGEARLYASSRLR